MSTLALEITGLVVRAAEAAGIDPATLPSEAALPCNNPEHGDYQSNLAFRLTKVIPGGPRAAADLLRLHLPPTDLIASVEVVNPGFLNFRVTPEALARDVEARVSDPLFGVPQVGAGRTVVFDYSSPNIAKRMHIGHLRSTIIGNALDRIHRHLGWHVIADNHLGDWGTPFGKLIVAWHEWADPDAFEADAVGELQRLYELFAKRAEEDPALIERARAETARLQQGDPANRELWSRFTESSLKEFNTIYARLGVRFDVCLGESFYDARLPSLTADLLERGLAVESDGAVILPFTEEDGKTLAKNPMLLRKRDGAVLYGATDLATVEHRINTWNPELIVILTDGRQQLHFRQVFAAARKVGWDRRFEHAWFGTLTLPGGGVASSRAGVVLNLADVLDAARDAARKVVDAKSPSLPDDERATIAETVGLGALKYFDLSQNRQSDVAFDWDRAFQVEGNTGPYLMYAHARACSIQRKAADAGVTPGALHLDHPAERALALEVARLPDAVLAAATNLKPNLLCEHLFTLAGAFSRFWDQCRVLGDDIHGETASSRLTLVRATALAMRTGLHLLGIEAPERL